MQAGIKTILFTKRNNIDANTKAFINAASITDPVQIAAINKLVKDLKAANLWNSIYMLKPYIGGNATAHSYNLINPANYQSTFFGGVTHNANGITGNGVNAYENTGCNPSLFPQDSVSMGFYGNGIVNANVVDMGLVQSSVLFYIESKSGGGLNGIGVNNTSFSTVTNVNGNGFYMASRQDVSTIKSYHNATELAVYSKTSTTPPTNFLPVMAYNNNGSLALYSSRNYRLSVIAAGFGNDEVSIFYNIVQTFQTDLGRAV
jgi:hypothetical protein